MEKTLEEYRRLLPAAEKYTYMNSAGCGPLPLPVLERMEGVFRRMALEGQVNVEIHGWLKEMLEEILRRWPRLSMQNPGRSFLSDASRRA